MSKFNQLAVTGISVVIPNYNGIKILPEVIPCLYEALQMTHLPYEVIVSDDCSTDGSIDFIERNYPGILLVRSYENCGFSKTINKGIYKAVYSHVLLLNSDVKLLGDYFNSLFSYFDLPDTFGVMGRIIGWNDDVIQDAAKFPQFHGAKIKTGGNYIANDPHSSDRLYSVYLSGANAFVDREKLLLLNGFDEIYSPFYVEDVDLSLRAWRIGWKCYYDHFALCRHHTSVTIKAKSRKYFIECIYYRNKMRFHAIHLSGWSRWVYFFQLFLETSIRIITGRFYYLKALLFFLKSGTAINKSRAAFFGIAAKSGSNLLSVNQVMSFIKKSIDGTIIKRF